MLKIAIFMTFLTLAVGYATAKGSGPERAAAAMMMLAAVLSIAMPYNDGRNFDRLYLTGFNIDLALLVGLIGLTVIANRYWPLWVAGLQWLTIGVHLAKAYDPGILPLVYSRVAGEIAYPMIAILIAGTLRHSARVAASGGERDWSCPRLY